MKIKPIVHQTGLIPPFSGPVKTWCGLRVPIEKTGHIQIRGRRMCKRCQRMIDRRKRLGIWPWSKRTARISQGMRLAWKRRKEQQA